jgi:hypothetical protein
MCPGINQSGASPHTSIIPPDERRHCIDQVAIPATSRAARTAILGGTRAAAQLPRRIGLYFDQGGACGAASGAPRAGLCLGRPRPARPRRPTSWQIDRAGQSRLGWAVFLGFDYLDRDHRVQGGPAGPHANAA